MASPDKEEAKNETDWAEIYTTFIAQTSMQYEKIRERTIPQLEAILDHLGKHIEIKMGIAGMGASMGANISNEENIPKKPGLADKAPKISEFVDFANDFKSVR